MGVVYEAVQASLDRRVALKVLRPELAEDAAFVDRIRREGTVQAALEHPHVLDVYEVGEAGDELFLTMRLVDGRRWPSCRVPAPGHRAGAGLLDQVAGALDAAHEAGLVHRDVKPQNVLVADGGDAFLTDFGLSRAATDTATASRPTLGTVAYIAPEVIRGEDTDAGVGPLLVRRDSLPLPLGRRGVPRGSDIAVIYAHTSEAPPRISERRPGLPARWTAISRRRWPRIRPSGPRARGRWSARCAKRSASRGADLGAPGRRSTRRLPRPALPPRRQAVPPPWIAAVVATGIGAAALGAGAAALSDDGDRRPEVPVPAVAKGATVIGSDLGTPDRSLDCRGDRPRGARSPARSSRPGARAPG